MDRNYIDYLPGVVAGLGEFVSIGGAVNPEWGELWMAIDSAMKDQFIEDATEYGVKRRENILKIASKETNTLEERKFRVLAKESNQLPYTIRTIKRQLENLCGADGYLVDMPNDVTFVVKVALAVKENYIDVVNLVEDITPVNLVLDISLLYNQHSTLAKFTHGQLNKWMHREIREEVLV